jgi:hypothetical protein
MRRLTITALAVGTAGALLFPSAATAFGASEAGRPLPTTARYAVLDTTTPTGSASPELTAMLVQMREEERMARDLYAGFLASYPESRVFSRINLSEQRHFAAVGRLLTAYGITDPAAGRATGSYADASLQAAYDEWKTAGGASKTAAYQAAVQLETRDIADLEKAIASTSDAQVLRVLDRLLAASKTHLAAFTQAANGTEPTPGPGTGPGAGQQGRMGQGPGRGQGNGQGTGLGNGGGAGNGRQGGMGSGMGTGAACPTVTGQAS